MYDRMTPFGSAGEVHVTTSSDGEPGTADSAGCCGADGTTIGEDEYLTNISRPSMSSLICGYVFMLSLK